MVSLPPRLLIAGTAPGVGKSTVSEAIAASRTPLPATLTLSLPLDLSDAWQSLQAAQPVQSTLLIEAPGSLGTPVTFETTVADLAWDWRLPTLLVAAVTPHCLAQLTAYAALAQKTRCPLLGVVLNCTTPEAAEHLMDWADPRQVAALTQLTVLGKLPYLENPADPQQLAAAAAALDWD